MSGFRCPFCGMIMAVTDDTYKYITFSFSSLSQKWTDIQRAIELQFYNCPNCGEISVYAKGNSEEIADLKVNIYPRFNCQNYPDYIPEAIRSDYKEACAIVELSPKASATLSRRCLQGMISDYWGIKKDRLVDAIDELEDKIPADLFRAINSLRKLGNIGAHMEKDINLIVDIDPDEAQKLITLIELLMKEWYINRHEREELYGNILSIDAEKQAQRKSSGS